MRYCQTIAQFKAKLVVSDAAVAVLSDCAVFELVNAVVVPDANVTVIFRDVPVAVPCPVYPAYVPWLKFTAMALSAWSVSETALTTCAGFVTVIWNVPSCGCFTNRTKIPALAVAKCVVCPM